MPRTTTRSGVTEPYIRPEDYPGLRQASADVLNDSPPWLREAIAASPGSRTCPLGSDCTDKACLAIHPFSETQQARVALLLSPVPVIVAGAA